MQPTNKSLYYLAFIEQKIDSRFLSQIWSQKSLMEARCIRLTPASTDHSAFMGIELYKEIRPETFQNKIHDREKFKIIFGEVFPIEKAQFDFEGFTQEFKRNNIKKKIKKNKLDKTAIIPSNFWKVKSSTEEIEGNCCEIEEETLSYTSPDAHLLKTESDKKVFDSLKTIPELLQKAHKQRLSIKQIKDIIVYEYRSPSELEFQSSLQFLEQRGELLFKNGTYRLCK